MKIQNLIKKEYQEFYQKYLQVFIFSIIIGFITHGFAFANKLINWDDMEALYSLENTLSTGRWGAFFLREIVPDISYSIPWLNGICSIVLISLSAVLIIEMYKVENRKYQFVISAIMLTTPALTATFSYMFVASTYALSIFLSVFSVYIVNRHRNLRGIVFASLILTVSLSLYQVYISLAVTLLVILIIKEIIENRNFKDIFKQGIKYVGFLLISGVIYILINKIVLTIYNTQLADYQGMSSMVNFSLGNLIEGLKWAYLGIYYSLFTSNSGIVTNLYLQIGYIVLMIFTAFNLIYLSFKKIHDIKNSILMCLLVLIFPVAINCIIVINTGVNYHTLMTYSYVSIFILSMVVVAKTTEITRVTKTMKNMIIVSSCIIIVNNVSMANKAYLKAYFSYENAYSFNTTLVTQIKSNVDYNQNLKIAIIGVYKGEDVYKIADNYEGLDAMIGIPNNIDIINSSSRVSFLKYFIGIGNTIMNDEENELIKKTQEYINMPCYPLNGSIKLINDTMVVKFS